jgi:hypothetical protein
MTDDPTRVRSQSSLTTSTGRIWLVLGGILAAICVAVLLLEIAVNPPLAIVGAVLVAALYAAMVAVRLRVLPLRRRLGILAILLLVLVVVTLLTLVLIVIFA